MAKISAGDRLTIEVDVARAWDDGQVTFSLRGHPGMITIPGDSPQIVKGGEGRGAEDEADERAGSRLKPSAVSLRSLRGIWRSEIINASPGAKDYVAG